jgi:uncharacterized protein (TIGR02266 family)
MSRTSKEQRGTQRVPIKLKVDCQYEGNFLFENAINISEHGIFIETREPMPAGTMIDLQFKLDEGDRAVEVLGEVIWINPVRPEGEKNHNPGMGIRFVNMKEIDKERVLSLIKRIAVL